MKVNVKMSVLADPEVVQVELTPDEGNDRSWTVTTIPEGKDIGRVYKDSYTYSPPAAGHRGRIARYHTSVSSWSSETRIERRNFRHSQTRRQALVHLIRAHRGEL